MFQRTFVSLLFLLVTSVRALPVKEHMRILGPIESRSPVDVPSFISEVEEPKNIGLIGRELDRLPFWSDQEESKSDNLVGREGVFWKPLNELEPEIEGLVDPAKSAAKEEQKQSVPSRKRNDTGSMFLAEESEPGATN